MSDSSLNLYTNGSDIQFDYAKQSELRPPADSDASLKLKRKKKKKKRTKSAGAAAFLVGNVTLTDPSADYPQSRVIKTGPNGELVVESLDDDPVEPPAAPQHQNTLALRFFDNDKWVGDIERVFQFRSDDERAFWADIDAHSREYITSINAYEVQQFWSAGCVHGGPDHLPRNELCTRCSANVCDDLVRIREMGHLPGLAEYMRDLHGSDVLEQYRKYIQLVHRFPRPMRPRFKLPHMPLYCAGSEVGLDLLGSLFKDGDESTGANFRALWDLLNEKQRVLLQELMLRDRYVKSWDEEAALRPRPRIEVSRANACVFKIVSRLRYFLTQGALGLEPARRIIDLLDDFDEKVAAYSKIIDQYQEHHSNENGDIWADGGLLLVDSIEALSLERIALNADTHMPDLPWASLDDDIPSHVNIANFAQSGKEVSFVCERGCNPGVAFLPNEEGSATEAGASISDGEDEDHAEQHGAVWETKQTFRQRQLEQRGLYLLRAIENARAKFREVYDRKVADDRTRKFMEELEAEENAKKEKELKKLKQKEKQKERKRIQQLEREESRKLKEAEELQKAEELKQKQEELRVEQIRRKEEERLRREEERRQKIEALKQKELEIQKNKDKMASDKVEKLRENTKLSQTKTAVTDTKAQGPTALVSEAVRESARQAPNARMTRIDSQVISANGLAPEMASSKPTLDIDYELDDILPSEPLQIPHENEQSANSPANHLLEQLYLARPRLASTIPTTADPQIGPLSRMGSTYSPTKRPMAFEPERWAGSPGPMTTSMAPPLTNPMGNVMSHSMGFGNGAPAIQPSQIQLDSGNVGLFPNPNTWMPNPSPDPFSQATPAPATNLPGMWSGTRNGSIWATQTPNTFSNVPLRMWAALPGDVNLGPQDVNHDSIQKAALDAVNLSTAQNPASPANVIAVFQTTKAILKLPLLGMSEFLRALHGSGLFEVIYDDFGSVTHIRVADGRAGAPSISPSLQNRMAAPTGPPMNGGLGFAGAPSNGARVMGLFPPGIPHGTPGQLMAPMDGTFHPSDLSHLENGISESMQGSLKELGFGTAKGSIW